MHTASINGKARPVATTWNELGREQLLHLMPILHGRYDDPLQQRLELLAGLLGVSLPLLLRFTDVQLVQWLPLTDFLLAEQLDFTRQLLPSVRLSWHERPLWGPGDELAGLSFLEFVFADSYFVAYAQTQEATWRHHLLAVLYRPQRRPYRPHAADYAGDRRQDFNQHLVDARVPVVARLPLAQQQAIATWYRGCRHAFEQRYPLVFTPHNEQAAQQAGGWDHVLREMSGEAFGSWAETGRQPTHQLLAKMQDDAERAAQLQRDSPQPA